MKSKQLIAVLAGVGCLGMTAWAGTDTKDVKQAVERVPEVGYLESKQNFYAEVTGGAILFRGPDKDNTNVFTGTAVALGPITGNPIPTLSNHDTTGSIGGKFGYVIQHESDPESLIGSNLRAEVSGDYYQTSSGLNTTISPGGGGYVAVGFLDGANGNGATPAPLINIGNTSGLNYNANNEVYHIDGVFKSDYNLAGGSFTATPKLGFSYAHIDQRSHTNVDGSLAGVPTFSHQQETIDSDYYGGVFGMEFKANVSKDFVMFIDTTSTVGYSNSDYHGNQQYFSTFNFTGHGTDSVVDSRSDFSLRQQGNGGFYYTLGPVILKVSGGFDYWTSVSTIKAAQPPIGSSLVGSPDTTPSHLVNATMLNPQANVSLTVPF